MHSEIKRNVTYMSLLRNKSAGEITGFIRGWLYAIDAHNDELNDQNAVFRVLRDILEYACPNEFGKQMTSKKQQRTSTTSRHTKNLRRTARTHHRRPLEL